MHKDIDTEFSFLDVGLEEIANKFMTKDGYKIKEVFIRIGSSYNRNIDQDRYSIKVVGKLKDSLYKDNQEIEDFYTSIFWTKSEGPGVKDYANESKIQTVAFDCSSRDKLKKYGIGVTPKQRAINKISLYLDNLKKHSNPVEALLYTMDEGLISIEPTGKS